MHRLNYLPLLTLVALLFTLVSCAPNTNPSPYPNPVTVAVSSTATHLPVTPASIGKWTATNIPGLPSPAPNFGKGYLADLSNKDALNYSDEELFEVLVGQWLERHKTGVIPTDAIKDYQVDKVTIEQADNSEVIAWVDFSVQPVEYSPNWASITVRQPDPNDPWRRVGGIFAIYRDGEYIRLKWLPSWGT